MIRNIIFDMGGVLVHYDPEHFVDLLSVSAEDKALLMREVFRTVTWLRMDRGTIGEAEAAASMKANLPPRLHSGVDRLMAWWELELRPMEGMEDLVRELKELGIAGSTCSPTPPSGSRSTSTASPSAGTWTGRWSPPSISF